MKKPSPTTGLRHLALFVQNFEACEHFYSELLGMRVEWCPDEDNVYLTSGYDNLALHRAKPGFQPGEQRLDHLGFILNDIQDVDDWHAYLTAQGVSPMSPAKTHRDGARSFYCADPDGNSVQMIYHPPLVLQEGTLPTPSGDAS